MLLSKQVILCFFLSCLVFFGCKKKEFTYDFEGSIQNSLTGNPTPSASITVSQVLFDNNVINPNFVFAESAKCNAQGKYTLSFSREKATEFKYLIQSTGYFSMEQFETTQTIDVGEINSRNFTLTPKGYVRFNIKNVGNLNSADNLAFFAFNFRENCNECIKSGYSYFTNDTSILVATAALQYATFFYKDQVSGNVKNDSLLIPFNDTLVYDINY